jgi:hypothetical protein
MIPKPKTHRHPKYLKWLSMQPCCKCGRGQHEYLSVVAAHQNLYGRGVGAKSSDLTALPLCAHCHTIGEHTQGVKTFWGNTNRERLVIEYLSRFIMEDKK